MKRMKLPEHRARKPMTKPEFAGVKAGVKVSPRAAAVKGAAVLAVVAGTLAGCSVTPVQPVQPGIGDQSEPPVLQDLPLPAGAVVDAPGQAPDAEVEAYDWPGSLRPDRESPEERVPDIYKRGRIIVGVDQSQYLLSFRDNATGELKGFEVDLAREIARDIFRFPDRVDFRFVDSSKRTEALVSGQVDIVIRTMSITKERAAEVDFSVPYLDSSVRMLVPTSSHLDGAQDLSDERICVAAGSNTVNIARENFPQHELLRTRTWTDCLMALQQYQAGLLVGDETILAGFAAQDPLTTVAGEPFATQHYAVGIPKGYDGLTRQVNYTLNRVRTDGTWDAMFKRWLGPHIAPRTAPQPVYREENND